MYESVTVAEATMKTVFVIFAFQFPMGIQLLHLVCPLS
jgi:hypothetical protein